MGVLWLSQIFAATVAGVLIHGLGVGLWQMEDFFMDIELNLFIAYKYRVITAEQTTKKGKLYLPTVIE